MTNVARQSQFPVASFELPTSKPPIGDAFDRIDDPAESPARLLQARVLAYAQAAAPRDEKYPGWVRIATLLGGICLGWGLVVLAALPLLG